VADERSTTSAGNRSGVNWILEKLSAHYIVKALPIAKRFLPSPGTPSEKGPCPFKTLNQAVDH
jgi:hypothetical protein